jgi:hypothetical protein
MERIGIETIVVKMAFATPLYSANPAWVKLMAALAASIAAVIASIAAVIAVGVAIWQVRLQRQQLRHDLYGKRFDVYLSLRQFLNTLSELGKTVDATKLLRDTNQAEFLFKPDIEEFLQEVYKKASRWQSFKEKEERASKLGTIPLPDDLAKAESEHSWLISEAPKLARQKFGEYLKLSKLC